LCDAYFRINRTAEGELFRQLVPVNGLQATTVQGTLLLALHRLWVELFNRGGSDWDANLDQYNAYCEIALHYLCDGTFDAKKTSMVRHTITSVRRWMAGEIEGNWVLDLLNRTGILAYHWCLLHPELMPWQGDSRLEPAARPGNEADWPRDKT
jgi:hypothetical protein